MDDMPRTDDRLLTLARYLHGQGADGRAGIGALLAEVEQRYPGEIARMAAGLELQALGLARRAGV